MFQPVKDWFAFKSWKPFPYQQKAWKAFRDGKSGLIHVPTGSGKTYAATMGPIASMLEKPKKGLKLLYLTPLRAVSRDIEQALRLPIESQGWPLKVESRTGDTSGSRKQKQLKNPPDILITTPESLSVLLSREGSGTFFSNLQCVVVDEWHELMGGKRGSQTELCLAHLRFLVPSLRTWMLSATIGNLDEAACCGVGTHGEAEIITAKINRKTRIQTLVPNSLDSFPWAGHLGLSMLPELLESLDRETSTLIFTNTRSQCERWYQALKDACPEMNDQLALHHSSIDRADREAIESRVKEGSLKWVVCTSSLDLGIDFHPVERVVQIGSAKAVARLLQRAGRSAHYPEGRSEILFVPTNSLELAEISAIRRVLKDGGLEKRLPQQKPFDVLMQHLVTLACGDGFCAEAYLEVIRSAHSFRDLTEEEYDWLLTFLEKGGKSLKAYPQYRKLVREEGVYKIAGKDLARLHRMSIGTIVSDAEIQIRYTNRRKIGTIEEYFISRLKRGDVFVFSGRMLEFLRLHDMSAYVKPAKKSSKVVPAWIGGRIPITDLLSEALRRQLNHSHSGDKPVDTEMKILDPVLQTQQRLSMIPAENELLIEQVISREGRHLFVFPFEGRFVHEGLAALWSMRFVQREPSTFSVSVNDYGFELLAPVDYPFEEGLDEVMAADPDQLEAQVADAVNLSELTQRRFRGVAQVAGLVSQGYPGSRKTEKQLQMSTSLLHGVFEEFEPEHLLLQQARDEVLEIQLEAPRLRKSLERMQNLNVVWKNPPRPTPLAFPLLVERMSARMTNETLMQRIDRMKRQWEKY